MRYLRVNVYRIRETSRYKRFELLLYHDAVAVYGGKNIEYKYTVTAAVLYEYGTNNIVYGDDTSAPNRLNLRIPSCETVFAYRITAKIKFRIDAGTIRSTY